MFLSEIHDGKFSYSANSFVFLFLLLKFYGSSKNYMDVY